MCSHDSFLLIVSLDHQFYTVHCAAGLEDRYTYLGVACAPSLETLETRMRHDYGTRTLFTFRLHEVTVASCTYICSRVYASQCRCVLVCMCVRACVCMFVRVSVCVVSVVARLCQRWRLQCAVREAE